MAAEEDASAAETQARGAYQTILDMCLENPDEGLNVVERLMADGSLDSDPSMLWAKASGLMARGLAPLAGGSIQVDTAKPEDLRLLVEERHLVRFDLPHALWQDRRETRWAVIRAAKARARASAGHD